MTPLASYTGIVAGTFIDRPNRFIAHVLIDGTIETCHVKNTGRCRELLLPGAKVWCQTHDSQTRKTKYSLIAVEKGTRLINMATCLTVSQVYCILRMESRSKLLLVR